ncbi:MAG: hypothetical protein GX158_02595 [Bacteroidales bacterium]|jgi:hypothetical protein|nr:hypothetical protein [Bacteroidales bacterium]
MAIKKNKEFDNSQAGKSIVFPFKPLSEWDGKQGICSNEDIPEWGLTERLSRGYGLSGEKISHLIRYVVYAFGTSSYFEEEIKVVDFEKNREPILSVRFESRNKQITIRDPNIIDKLYKLLLGENNLFKLQKPFDKEIIKHIAVEVLKEITGKEGIPEQKAYCIVGFIFAYHGYGICKEKIMTEGEFIYDTIDKESKNILVKETYTEYLARRIREYITD